jgi:hypothetical protein
MQWWHNSKSSRNVYKKEWKLQTKGSTDGTIRVLSCRKDRFLIGRVFRTVVMVWWWRWRRKSGAHSQCLIGIISQSTMSSAAVWCDGSWSLSGWLMEMRACCVLPCMYIPQPYQTFFFCCSTQKVWEKSLLWGIAIVLFSWGTSPLMQVSTFFQVISVRCYGSWSLGHCHRRFYQTTVLFLNSLSFLFLCSLGFWRLWLFSLSW